MKNNSECVIFYTYGLHNIVVECVKFSTLPLENPLNIDIVKIKRGLHNETNPGRNQ